jgi:hypothetical protein
MWICCATYFAQRRTLWQKKASLSKKFMYAINSTGKDFLPVEFVAELYHY